MGCNVKSVLIKTLNGKLNKDEFKDRSQLFGSCTLTFYTHLRRFTKKSFPKKCFSSSSVLCFLLLNSEHFPWILWCFNEAAQYRLIFPLPGQAAAWVHLLMTIFSSQWSNFVDAPTLENIFRVSFWQRPKDRKVVMSGFSHGVPV